MKDDFDFRKHNHLDDDLNYDSESDWDEDSYDDDDEYDEYWDGEDDDMEVVVDSAEGLQVATTFDGEGNVIDVTVTPEEDIDLSDSDVTCPLNSFIDHTLLKADATVEQITKLCQEAREYRFASVCKFLLGKALFRTAAGFRCCCLYSCRFPARGDDPGSQGV